MLVLDFNNRYFLLYLLFFLLRLHLSIGVDLRRKEHCCSFGEEQKIRIFQLDEVKPHEKGDEKQCIDDHVESIIKAKFKNKQKEAHTLDKISKIEKRKPQGGNILPLVIIFITLQQRMLFGQWEDDNDRQKKAIKSKMYKEMLDNQILINQRYKKQKDGGRQYSETSQIIQKRHTSNVDHKRYETSGNEYDGDSNHKKHKYVNLPVLKDRNTYLKGQSKFVVVEPTVQKPAKKHFKTELIQEDQDDLDEYNSTCQKIIRELQSINKQTPKMKYRRKLYEYSDLAPNRKRYEKLKVEELKKSQAEVYNDFSKSTNKMDQSPNDNWSTKAKIGLEDRVPSFSMVESSKEGTIESITKPKSLKTNLTNIEPIKRNVENSKVKAEEPAINQFEQVRQAQKSERSPQVAQIAKESNPISVSSSSKPSNLERSRMKSNVQITKAPPITTQNDKIPQQNANNMKVHKENFLDLLRKVKNRGESLYIKLSAFPKQETKGDK